MKSLQSLIPPHIAEAIGGTLMHSLWQLGALALLLILVLALMPQQAARLRYWVAVGTMGLMLALPMATFGYLYEPPTVPLPSDITGMTAAAVAYTMHAQQPVATASTADLSLPEQVNAFFQDNAYLFLGIWLVGMVVPAVRFAGSCWQVHRLRRVGTQDVPYDLAARFITLLDQVGIKRFVGLRYSSQVDTPMVIGVLKPIVLLPMGLLSGLSMEQVECILIHELGHVRRWDYLLNVVQSIAEIILFYHPATWWVTKVIRAERENCCDELVVRLKANKVQYARALLNLEIMRQQTPALAMASQGGDLASRIRRITGGVMPPRRKFDVRGLLFGFLTFACITLLATQSHTVVKAALPFFMPDVPTETAPADTEPQDHKSVVTVVTDVTSDVATDAAGIATNWLGRFLGHLPSMIAHQDSPVTKISIVDDDEEVELRCNSAGKIVAGTRNGLAIPQDDLASYQNRISSMLSRHSPVSPVAPMSPMSPMSPMPAMPAMPPMPPMPSLAPLGRMNGSNFDSKSFEKQMEKFGKEMGKWGAQFEGEEWAQYGKQMEQWGQAIAAQIDPRIFAQFGQDIGAAVNSPEAKQIQADIADLSQKLSEAKTEDERDELTGQIDELAGRLGEISSEAIEGNMEVFEERMEQWGEQFAASMEQMADEQEARANEIEAQMDADRAQIDEDRAQADEDAASADEYGARAEDASAVIGEALVEDGLIKNPRSFKLKLNEDELYVNGKKQPRVLQRRYQRLVSDHLGISVGHDWVTIQHNSR
jgi:bla regulator protein blaR1